MPPASIYDILDILEIWHWFNIHVPGWPFFLSFHFSHFSLTYNVFPWLLFVSKSNIDIFYPLAKFGIKMYDVNILKTLVKHLLLADFSLTLTVFQESPWLSLRFPESQVSAPPPPLMSLHVHLYDAFEVARLALRLLPVVVDGGVFLVQSLLQTQQLRLLFTQLGLGFLQPLHRRTLAHLQLHNVTVQLTCAEKTNKSWC